MQPYTLISKLKRYPDLDFLETDIHSFIRHKHECSKYTLLYNRAFEMDYQLIMNAAKKQLKDISFILEMNEFNLRSLYCDAVKLNIEENILFCLANLANDCSATLQACNDILQN